MQHKLKDIARELGVSTATVSNSLNGSGRVSSETRNRIRTKVAELGYRPSLLGRALRTGRSGVVGLVLPDISNPLFPAIAQAIEAAAARAGFGVLIADSHSDERAQRDAIDRMVQRGADGIIVVPCRGTTVSGHALPVAIVDTASTPGNAVAADHKAGGTHAISHIQELGHRRIIALGESRKSSVQTDRVAGILDAVKPGGVCRVLWLEDGPAPDFGALIGEGFTALIATSDIHALMVLTSIQRSGHSVPRDMSVMGFDNLSFSGLISPALTTLAQDTATIAAHAVDHLVTRIAGNPCPDEQIVPMRLIIRDSTGAAPIPTPGSTQQETKKCSENM